MAMNQKQWVWLYQQIKKYIKEHEGKPPDDKAVADLFDVYGSIMEVTEKSRAESREIDGEITTVFKFLFDVMQSLELEAKPL